MRIGHGYDAHTFTEGKPLILGGVTIPHDTAKYQRFTCIK